MVARLLLTVRCVCLLLVVSLVSTGTPSASSLYRKAKKAEAKGDLANAYLLYSQAVALKPNNEKYWAASQAVRGGATEKLTIENTSSASAPLSESPLAVPTLPNEDEIEAQALLPPPRLKGSNAIRNFDLRGNPQELFEKVAREYSLDAVFDADYPPPAQPIRFKIDQADYKTALRALESVTSSFVIPVSERLFMVAKDTQQKRGELEPVVSVTIPFPENIVPQEMVEISNGVRQIFDLTKVGVDTAKRVLYIRDRVSRVRAAQAMLRQLMVHRAQVVVEVELLAVNDTRDRTFGMTLPTEFSLFWLTDKGFLRPTPLPTTISGLLLFGGGYTLFGLGVTNASLFATATETHSRSVVRSELRSLDGQAAALHIGDRYPIITLGYYGGTATEGQTVYTPPPNITFEDLGIVLKVTPKVHSADEVSLDVEAEFKALAGQSLNGIPVISNRKFKSIVRMRFSEAAIMAGLVGDTISQSWSGIPGLSMFPALRSNSKSQQKNELLLVLRPRLVTLPPSEAIWDPIWSGTDTKTLSVLD